nr:hypothetical protein [uncultured Allomuricauda sp.]
MKLSTIKEQLYNLFCKLLNIPNLRKAEESLKAENDPYEIAMRELKGEIAEQKKESEELDKALAISLHRLKQVDRIYHKVRDGEVINDLESDIVSMLRIKST